MKQTGKSESPRRHFLRQLMVLGGAAGAGAIIAQGLRAQASLPQADHTDSTAAQNKGYRLTEHIRTYYEKAQI